MSQTKLQELYNFCLLSAGTTGTTLAFWSNVDLIAGLILKATSLVSFFIFLIINQDNISKNWSRFTSRFKTKKRK